MALPVAHEPGAVVSPDLLEPLLHAGVLVLDDQLPPLVDPLIQHRPSFLSITLAQHPQVIQYPVVHSLLVFVTGAPLRPILVLLPGGGPLSPLRTLGQWGLCFPVGFVVSVFDGGFGLLALVSLEVERTRSGSLLQHRVRGLFAAFLPVLLWLRLIRS